MDLANPSPGSSKQDNEGEPPEKRVRKKTFLDQWLGIPEFTGWLQAVPDEQTKAFCTCCQKKITCGRSEIQKHAKTSSHIRKHALATEIETVKIEYKTGERLLIDTFNYKCGFDGKMSRTNQLPNLDKLFKDEDDQDFTPLGGSNLAAIFGAPQNLADASSTSVKRNLPKKPSVGKNTAQTVEQNTPTNTTRVIIAKAVLAYMLQNGQYSLIGKLGVALTGNDSSRMYQIILYKSKTEHISVVTLKPEFNYTIRENNYATYYDDKGDNWSLHFENEESCIQVAREVGVSKFMCKQTKSDDSVMHQDLSVHPQGLEAKEGDKITVKTTISSNLIQPLNYNDFSSPQTLNVEISQDENWEKSLVNCTKGLKRLMFLLPSKQISLGPGYPKDKEIIMEIEVIDVVRPEAKTSACNPVPKPPVAVTGKPSILLRMAKMGQSMLPKVPTTTDSDDTEEEVHVKSPRRLKPESGTTKHHTQSFQESSEKKTLPVTSVLVAASNVPLSQTPIIQPSGFPTAWTEGPIQQQYIGMNGQYYPIVQAPRVAPQPMDPNINVLLSETRTHNAEIRMGMSKIADNVQKLLDKFHVFEVQNASSQINERAMETSFKMLMALSASQDLTAKGKNVVNPRPDSSSDDGSSKELITTLEKELNDAKELLEKRAKVIEVLENEKREWSSEKNDLCKKIQHLEKTLADSNITLQKAIADLNNANNKTAACKKDNINLEEKIVKLNPEINKISENAEASSTIKQTTIGNDNAVEIKQIMNKTYQALLAKFTKESYTTEYIKQTVAKTIRNITLQVLEESRDDYESESNNFKEKEESRESILDSKVSTGHSDSSGAVDSDNNDNDKNKNSVLVPEVDQTVASITDIKVTAAGQEEPPPIPPKDINTELE